MIKDSVPGLTRGLKVLEILKNGKRIPLHELQRIMSIPKSSLLRVMETLVENDYAERDESGAYRSKVRIVPFENSDALDGKIEKALKQVAALTEHTAEWYIPTDNNTLILVKRNQPDNPELHVVAKIGFIRKTGAGHELDAVAAVAAVYMKHADTEFEERWIYKPEGIKCQISSKEASEIIRSACDNAFCSELNYNSNGVRRIAVPVLDGRKLLGVLAVAQCYMPGIQPDDKEKVRILFDSRREIEN